MAIRSTVGSMLESAIGRERTNNLRRLERRTRNAIATRIAMEPPKKAAKSPPKPVNGKPANRKPRSTVQRSRWQPPDPFTPHPEPIMTRHELLEDVASEDAAPNLSRDRDPDRQQHGAIAHPFYRSRPVVQDRQADPL
jgi:hypothetical protein